MSKMLNHSINTFSLAIKLALLLLVCILERTEARHSLHECNVRYKCSDEKKHVFAIDEERCHIFHNRCLLKVEQCARRDQGKSELVEADRETCKQNCEVKCVQIFEPVCAQFFQEEYITFGNECHMRNYICSQERAYSFYAIGECVEFPSSKD